MRKRKKIAPGLQPYSDLLIQSSCSEKEGIFYMSYFTTTESFFVVPLSNNDEEIRKIDYLLLILEDLNQKSYLFEHYRH